MRITKICIKNFRAFYGSHSISLDRDGKNLMLFGENGSGKSSFYYALKTFFEASGKPVNMVALENIFIPASERGSCEIKVTLKESSTSTGTTEVSISKANPEINGRERTMIASANKVKGFFDYKSLLKTHLSHKADVNLFDLMVDEIFCDQETRFVSPV